MPLYLIVENPIKLQIKSLAQFTNFKENWKYLYCFFVFVFNWIVGKGKSNIKQKDYDVFLWEWILCYSHDCQDNIESIELKTNYRYPYKIR